MKEEPGFMQKLSTNNTIYFYQQPVIANQNIQMIFYFTNKTTKFPE